MFRESVLPVSGDSFEEARSLEQQLTFKAASAAFKKSRVAFGKNQMRSLHLIAEDGDYTNLGLLLSDQCPCVTKIALFEGSSKTIFKDRCELSGSLLKQFDDAGEFIDRCNRTRSEFPGFQRVDIRDYPVEAVREALLNVLVHRDYSYSAAPTLISIFDDRMEFVSIGGLVRGLSVGEILNGVSLPRNKYLADVFYRLKLIEAYGTGIPKIMECYAGSARKAEIKATDNSFRLILPNVNYRDSGGGVREDAFRYYTYSSSAATEMDRKKTVIELCREREVVSRSDVQTALGVSQSTAILLLRAMLSDGTLVKEGNARNIRYRLK